jgi:hypothetical protein
MRRILRKIAENELGSLGDTSTLADPSVVDDLVKNQGQRLTKAETARYASKRHAMRRPLSFVLCSSPWPAGPGRPRLGDRSGGIALEAHADDHAAGAWSGPAIDIAAPPRGGVDASSSTATAPPA